MEIVINTAEPLTDLESRVLRVLLGENVQPAKSAASVMKEEAAAASKKATATKKAEPKKEPEPEPEPMAEEPLPEEDEDDEEPAEDDGTSDEDLLALAVKKATEMVGSGEAAKVREALDAAGASRVRELNKDNVREFFKALS